MPEISSCPRCKRPVSVPDRLIGRTVRCPSCKSTYIARSVTAEAEPAEEAPPPVEEKEKRPRRRSIEETEDDEDRGYRPAPFRDIHVTGWERVRVGLILMVSGFGVALISTLILTISSQSDASAVAHSNFLKGGRGEDFVKEGAAALVCMFTGGAADNSSNRTTLWILSLVGIGLAMLISAVGSGFCMHVPRDHRARATAMTSLVLGVMGYAVFLAGCIWGYMEFEGVTADAASKTAPTSFGMIAAILGFTLLLAQPLAVQYFLRSAGITARYETVFPGVMTFGMLVGGFGVLAYITGAIGSYWVVRDTLEAMAGSRMEGGVDILGTIGGIAAIVAFFVFLTFSLWHIAAIFITRNIISGHVAGLLTGATKYPARPHELP
jgi:hypothetical protein